MKSHVISDPQTFGRRRPHCAGEDDSSGHSRRLDRDSCEVVFVMGDRDRDPSFCSRNDEELKFQQPLLQWKPSPKTKLQARRAGDLREQQWVISRFGPRDLRLLLYNQWSDDSGTSSKREVELEGGGAGDVWLLWGKETVMRAFFFYP